ncbi:MAG: uracil-DNA glycosylase [Bacilli bacterium]|nr:uracil-DNA glycosylase [Bacilli bacterium]
MLSDWSSLFNIIKGKDYAKRLKNFLDGEYAKYTIYPPRNLIYNAFHQTTPNNLKVVIIGQDPYHEPNQAMGMCFSVPHGVDLPPSLVNIYQEIENEYQIKMKRDGDLTYLAKQGCLLLNTILSVRAHQPLSHNVAEYKSFIADVLNYIDTLNQPIVFMLWGNNAKQYQQFIHNPNRLVLTSVHPSPLSANRGGWFNNGHFKKCNDFLKNHNSTIINWDNNLSIR